MVKEMVNESAPSVLTWEYVVEFHSLHLVAPKSSFFKGRIFIFC